MCVSVSTPIPQIEVIFDTTTTPLRLFLEGLVSGLHVLDNLLEKKKKN